MSSWMAKLEVNREKIPNGVRITYSNGWVEECMDNGVVFATGPLEAFEDAPIPHFTLIVDEKGVRFAESGDDE